MKGKFDTVRYTHRQHDRSDGKAWGRKGKKEDRRDIMKREKRKSEFKKKKNVVMTSIQLEVARLMMERRSRDEH